MFLIDAHLWSLMDTKKTVEGSCFPPRAWRNARFRPTLPGEPQRNLHQWSNAIRKHFQKKKKKRKNNEKKEILK